MAELTAKEIEALLAGQSKRGGRKDTTEPRTLDNWWKQEHHFIDHKNNPELKCMNAACTDPRGDDAALILVTIKGQLICRFCFLGGYLSGNSE